MADDDGWRFELDDLPESGGDEDGVAGDGAAGDGAAGDGAVVPEEIPVEPEPWTLESAAFVVLGVAVTLFVFLRFAIG